MTIQFPIDPKEDDYEDLVAACLIALGYFIETNLHLRAGTTEVLELDVVATPVNDPLEGRILLDAKSGKSGFADIFKMSGWMHYLHINKGCVVRSQSLDAHKTKALEAVCKATNVVVTTLNMEKLAPDALLDASVSVPAKTREALTAAAWWGRMGQRKCLSAFQSFCNSRAGAEAVKAAKAYRWAIEQSFFAATPIRRAGQLYAAYMEAPQLTGRVLQDLVDGDETRVKQEWAKVRDTHERLGVQHVMIMEHTARLGIMKNALLHVLEREASPDTAETDKHGIDWSSFEESGMPSSFRGGLETLKQHAHRTRIPLLFQVFIEVFGGFYALHDDRDLQALAACTGIPADEVEGCLKTFDAFFPIDGGWFITGKDELCHMKMVPAVFHGTGCFLRNSLFGEKDYTKLFPQMGWLLGRWHNALYKALEPDLKVTTE